jgi:hypothetical protein
VILVSFDIDGTLEAGDPRGPITFANVLAARERGYIIGSSSDRTLSEQRVLWAAAGIEPDFMCNKPQMVSSTEHFEVSRRLHIGDTTSDEYYAGLAGFEFVHVDDLPAEATPGWIY